jgi:hypothetical protein
MKFDLNMFWTLPRTKGQLMKLIPGDSKTELGFCAYGACLRALGEEDMRNVGLTFTYPGQSKETMTEAYQLLQTLKEKNFKRFKSIWKVNDSEDECGTEKAKRMLMDWLIEENMVEFTEDPVKFKLPVLEGVV